uniref:Uncharacterized protein n=1 Tax=Zooxanthella nutricula TaxID=1333877 RepID=A0A7S2LAQ5_9DINO
MEGGGRHGAEPGEATATIAVPAADLPRAKEVVTQVDVELRAEHGRSSPEIQLRLEQRAHAEDSALSEESTERLLDLMLLLPDGVLRQSAEIPGSVETSSTIARVRQEAPGMLEVLVVLRSTVPSALRALKARVARAAQRLVATADFGAGFPGWTPNRTAPLVVMAQEVFRKVEGRAVALASLHGSSEVAALLERIPHLEAVSFGPDVAGAKQPGECVKVDSVEKTWDLTRRLLERLAASESLDSDLQAVDL